MQFHQPLGNGQPQTQALLLVQFAVELHIGANARDLLGGEPAALVADGQRNGVERLVERHAHRRVGLGKLEGILHEFVRDFAQVFLGDGQWKVRQFK